MIDMKEYNFVIINDRDRTTLKFTKGKDLKTKTLNLQIFFSVYYFGKIKKKEDSTKIKKFNIREEAFISNSNGLF
ncbi:hypothetical protein DN407_31085 (plasmid) [Bacillus sp. JAS24-2]|nr:hypothetical protein DN407_31085 [Bacillus sp. JAS24-2]